MGHGRTFRGTGTDLGAGGRFGGTGGDLGGIYEHRGSFRGTFRDFGPRPRFPSSTSVSPPRPSPPRCPPAAAPLPPRYLGFRDSPLFKWVWGFFLIALTTRAGNWGPRPPPGTDTPIGAQTPLYTHNEPIETQRPYINTHIPYAHTDPPYIHREIP